MSRRIERLPTPQGVSAGQTATLNIPLGATFHRIDLRLKASAANGTPTDVTEANWKNYIGDIRLMVNGNTQIEVTAEYLIQRAKFHGYTLEDGVLPIFLSSPWARTQGGEDQTSYGTIGMQSFTLEVEFKTGKKIGDFKVYAEQSAPENYGPHLCIQRLAKSFAVTGIDEIADLPNGPFNMLNLDVMDANIDEIEIFADNNRVHVSDKAIRQNGHKIAKRSKQSGMTHLDFIQQDRIEGSMPMHWQDFRLKLDFTTAPDAYNIYITTIKGAA